MAFAVRLRIGDQLFGVAEPVLEFEKHLRPDFKNGRADRGAQRGMHVFGARAVLLLHPLNRSCDDARERAPPSGVRRRERAGAFVSDQNRQTIGRLNRQQNTRRVGRQRVARRWLGSGVFYPVDKTYIRLMKLLRGDERPSRRVERGEKPAAVFEHVLAFVLTEISQAERLRRQRADAAQAGAESVFEADPFNRIADQQPQVVDITKREMLHLKSQISNLKSQISNLIMIAGIGVDIVEISRLERAIREHRDRFVNRVFTEREIEYCERVARKAERYATRFAAKEAARKALGAATPIAALSWHDVEIISSTEGAPQLQFHGRAAELVEKLKIVRAHVSLSHAQDQAAAFVVLEIE